MKYEITVILACLLMAALAQAEPAPAAPAAEAPASKPGIRYKSGKDVDFEALLIQGQMKRAEISVVTGDIQQGSNGLLRLREDFNDRIAADIGESFGEEAAQP